MRLHGPQSDRERSLGRAGLALSTSGLRSSLNATSNRQTSAQGQDLPYRELESHTVEAEVNRLQRENSLLSEQLERSLQVLKAYQLKYPSAYIELQRDEDSDLPPWVTTADAFLPLFDSYDTRIKELEDVINLKTLELSKFQGIVDKISTENEQLRELQLKQVHSTGYVNMPVFSAGSNNASEGKLGSIRYNLDTNALLQNEIIAELNERIDILMAENGLLAEQKLSLSHELEQHHTDLSSCTKELKTLQSNYLSLKKDHNQLKIALQQVESDRNEAGVQALNFSEGLSKADAQLNASQEQLAQSKVKETQLTKTIQDLRKEMESNKKGFDDEIFDTMKGIKVLEDRIRELQAALYERTQENDTSQDIIRKLRREYQNTRQDAEGMLQVMSGLEKQVSEYATREAEVEKLAKDSKIKIAEAIGLRDQALLREKMLNEEIHQLMEENKKISRDQYKMIEEEILVVTNKGKDQLLHSEKEMKKMAEIIAKLRAEYDTSIRESKSSQDHIDRLKRLHSDEMKVADDSMSVLHNKLNEAISLKELETNRKVEVQELNKDLRNTVDKLRSQVDSLKLQLLQSERSRKTETTSYKTTIRDLERDIHEKSKLIEQYEHDLDELKHKVDLTISTNESKCNEEVNSYRHRAFEAEKALRDCEESLSASDSRTQHLIEKLKDSSQFTINQLENQMEAEREKLRYVVGKASDRDEQIASLSEENKKLLSVIDEAKGTIQELEDELDEANEKISDLTDQLISNSASSSLSRQPFTHDSTRIMESMDAMERNTLELT